MGEDGKELEKKNSKSQDENLYSKISLKFITRKAFVSEINKFKNRLILIVLNFTDAAILFYGCSVVRLSGFQLSVVKQIPK